MLSSLLFLIYVNDLVKMNLKGSLYLFADNTVVVYFGKNKNKFLEKINENMESRLIGSTITDCFLI